jgi:hypothetical protein
MKIISRIGTRTLAAFAGVAMLATAGAASAHDWRTYRGADHGWHYDRGYHYGWRNTDRYYYSPNRSYYSPSRSYYWNAPRGRDGRIDTKCPKYC